MLFSEQYQCHISEYKTGRGAFHMYCPEHTIWHILPDDIHCVYDYSDRMEKVVYEEFELKKDSMSAVVTFSLRLNDVTIEFQGDEKSSSLWATSSCE